MLNKFISNYFTTIFRLSNKVNILNFKKFLKLLNNVKKNKKKIIIVGNGGSASIASHLTVDFNKVCNIRTINFNESSLITCLANDYGYAKWVEETLKFYFDIDDIVILISSSGESKNIINAAQYAKKVGLKVVTFTGFKYKNKLSKLGDINFWVKSKSYNIVETIHQNWLLLAVDYLANLNLKKNDKKLSDKYFS